MKFQLYLTPKVRKKLRAIQEKDRKRVLNALEAILSDPFSEKQLHGQRATQYSVRVWPHRIIYRVDKDKLLIIVIEFGHRQGIY